MSTATKTASKKNSKKSPKIKGYAAIMKHVDGIPLAKRRELPIGRDGAKVKPRGYHLNEDKIAKLAEQYKDSGKDLNVLANAYNKGSYHYIIAALLAMGVDEQHGEGRVFNKMKSLMSAEDTKDADGNTAWERFEGKDPRSDGGLDVDGRFAQNVVVLQRVSIATSSSPYGYKLLQVMQEVAGKKGGVIDVLVAETGTRYLRLNTKSDSPINETKKRGMGSPAAIAAEKEAAKAARKGKAKTKARKSKAATPPAETAPAATTEAPAEVAQTA